MRNWRSEQCGPVLQEHCNNLANGMIIEMETYLSPLMSSVACKNGSSSFRDVIIVSFSSVVRHMLDLSTRQRVVVTASCWELILSIIMYVEFHRVATS